MATSYSGTEENNYWKVVNNLGKTLRHSQDCPKGTYRKGELMDKFKGFKAAHEFAVPLNAKAVRV